MQSFVYVNALSPLSHGFLTHKLMTWEKMVSAENYFFWGLSENSLCLHALTTIFWINYGCKVPIPLKQFVCHTDMHDIYSKVCIWF